MAIRFQCHANVSKQATILDGVDIGQLKWHVCGCGLNCFVHEGMNGISNVKVHFKDSQLKCKYIHYTCDYGSTIFSWAAQ